ncbi:hypothetical protein ACWCOT_16840 [Nonomuraea bangladeshensis]
MDDNLAKALMWDGVRCVISIFVVHAWELAPALDLRTDQVVPRQVKVYELEDEDGLLPGRRVPEQLPGYLEDCLDGLEAEERAGERWREVLQRHADVLAP